MSLLRFIVLWQLSNTSDVTYVFGSVTIVTSVEFAVAVVTANMPGVAGFYRHFKGKREREDEREQSLSRIIGDSDARERGRADVGGAHLLETIGAKSSRKKKQETLKSAFDSRPDNKDPWKGTESEERLTEYRPEAVV